MELLELIGCLRALRGGELLEDHQADAYEDTLLSAWELQAAPAKEHGAETQQDLARAETLAARMALIAEVVGDPAEAVFWEKLVPTLESLKQRHAEPNVSRCSPSAPP